MNNTSFYKYAAILLLIINLSMIAFFFVTKNHPHKKHSNPKEILDFDESQNNQFHKMVEEHILKALSQFQLSLVSSNSKYDLVQKKLAEFTIQEANGYKLFQQNCSSCHSEPLFSTYEFANNGLSIDTTLNDFGKGVITKKTTDSLLFKIHSLRNLSFTHPYMHDGRFTKLNQVLKHYTKEIVSHSTLSNLLKKRIELTSNEQTDLIAFLLTLNDKDFVFNKKHQFSKEIFFPTKDLDK